MTTTVIFRDRMIEMKGNLTWTDWDGGYRIKIDGQDIAEVIEANFKQLPHDSFNPSGDYGRFKITIEKLRDKS